MGDDGDIDKEWAYKYLLDPLTAPEPSQETGPGSSHLSEFRRLQFNQSSSKPVRSRRKDPDIQLSSGASSSSGRYPTPPVSASPDRGSFHSSNPFSPTFRSSLLDTHREEDSPPHSPLLLSDKTTRRSEARLSAPPSYTSVVRSSSAREASGSSSSRAEQQPHRSASSRGRGHTHSRSLSARYPGDMSHRPLDTIKREVRAADRPQHKTRAPYADTIDALDTIGGAYHHGGPYDATLASRNSNKMYSPVAAVRESNMEAIRATPREYIQDSLDKHMPLQGTATIPVGAPDMRGRIMQYKEGPDLSRESGGFGGGYGRWADLPSEPDDLKKKKKERLPDGQFEMESGVNGNLRRGPGGRQRSFSHGHPGAPGAAGAPEAFSSATAYSGNDSGLRRNNTTGKRLGDGLKRRFGSIRRKKSPPAEQLAAAQAD